jgi:hypothetical protein
MKDFDRQHDKFLRLIDGPYHPLIYNQGNVANKAEFSESSLLHVLKAFDRDPRVSFVSLNSRQCYVTNEFLEFICHLELSYPIHFIFGQESFSSRAIDIFGKNTQGELKRFIDALKAFNRRTRDHLRAGYEFGLDVNLVFLPEMYLPNDATRDGNETLIAEGMGWELAQLLSRIDPLVPVEINLHPYYQVKTLPYGDMDVDYFMRELPGLQTMVDDHNNLNSRKRTHLFVGMEGSGYERGIYRDQLARWKNRIEEFNATGVLR